MWILTILIELDIRVWYIHTLHWQLKKEKYLPKHKTYEIENHEWDEREEKFYSQFSLVSLLHRRLWTRIFFSLAQNFVNRKKNKMLKATHCEDLNINILVLCAPSFLPGLIEHERMWEREKYEKRHKSENEEEKSIFIEKLWDFPCASSHSFH